MLPTFKRRNWGLLAFGMNVASTGSIGQTAESNSSTWNLPFLDVGTPVCRLCSSTIDLQEESFSFCVYSWVYISEELCTKLFTLFVSLVCAVNRTLLRIIFFSFPFDELLCQDFFFFSFALNYSGTNIYIYIIDTYTRAIDFIKVASAMNWVCLELSLWLGCLFLWRAAFFNVLEAPKASLC